MRQHIVVEISNGKSQRENARQLNIGQTTVRNIWKRFMDTGNTHDKPKSGIPMNASDRERRSICRLSHIKPFYTAREIYKEVRGPSVLSLSTVQRYLRQNGLFGSTATKKLLLSKRNIIKRNLWCKEYLKFRQSD